MVSTQLIEAGVDVDFPVVFRAACGLDSLTQAAGRCNREGRHKVGKVYAFDFPHSPPPGHLRQTADTAREILAGLQPHEDRLSPALLKRYFEHYYWRRSDCWDQCKVLCAVGRDPNRMQFDFRDMAARYRLIPDSGVPVFVPHGDLPLSAFDLEKTGVAQYNRQEDTRTLVFRSCSPATAARSVAQDTAPVCAGPPA